MLQFAWGIFQLILDRFHIRQYLETSAHKAQHTFHAGQLGHHALQERNLS